jgi:predicted SprT family Zn-dependent metalloprotease
LSKDELEGKTILEPSQNSLVALDYIWNKIVEVGMTNDKPKPNVKEFKYLMNAGRQVNGYYRSGGDTIYINSDLVNKSNELTKEIKKVVIHEIAHYLTGSRDCSVDFEDFAFNLAVSLMK